MNLELIPLLIIVLLMISAGGADVETTEFVIEGDHEITEHRGALIVGDATVTVPADEAVSGPVYVIGGELRVHGTVEGDVTQLSGSLVVEDGATIDGELQHIGGSEELSTEATIMERTTVAFESSEPGPIAAYTPTVLTTLILAVVGALLSRKHELLLDNVGAAAKDHPLISLTVGALLSVTFLSVFVFMAFTLILLPVSILGLLIGLLIIAYGIIALGYLAGQQLNTPRVGLATGFGVVCIMVLLQVIGVIPILGDLIGGGLLLTGLGAVVLTYFGLQEFEPVSLPE
ncbi:polymer-forming cytoskeletal protein [Haloterrigena sp. H1]|uniref:polymer-forming cytoskeletal protein n=1 Tax=Haloterrigena sp. H1 TaxID=2552943 RepID=UPI00110F4AD1|nr:polymer-forming cytoskeletal protein [Haloterrigena sp. H1]TMT81747.1 polymer-forming cytoskeletal protein [Haloterrigena sp. H1]